MSHRRRERASISRGERSTQTQRSSRGGRENPGETRGCACGTQTRTPKGAKTTPAAALTGRQRFTGPLPTLHLLSPSLIDSQLSPYDRPVRRRGRPREGVVNTPPPHPPGARPGSHHLCVRDESIPPADRLPLLPELEEKKQTLTCGMRGKKGRF